MRILVLSTLYPPVVWGGYEVECAGVVDRLRVHHDVRVLTSSFERRHVRRPETHVIRELPFLRYRKRDSLLAPLTTLRALRVTRRMLREVQPELIYVWNGSQIPQGALWVLQRAGSPVAYRICQQWFSNMYGDDPYMRYLSGKGQDLHDGVAPLRAAWARLIRLINRLPAFRLDPRGSSPASVCWSSEFIAFGGPPPTVRPVLERTVYPATPTSATFAAIDREPSPEPTIVFMGRVTPGKGVEVACRALAGLRDRHGVIARLIVAGPVDRDMRRRLARLTREAGIEDRVDVRGPLDTPALAALLAAAHALVIPSTWPEPAGLVCTEAALARVPVVASRVGGIAEMLHEGEHALFFDAGDAVGCADALAQTFDDGAATEARVARAFERGCELSFEPYMAATERFVAEACGPALTAPAALPERDRPS